MNIFALHTDPQTCAEMHCDKHVVKMILEHAQLMCTAHRVLDGTFYYGEPQMVEKYSVGCYQIIEKMFYGRQAI